jgi:hypothetical protein
MMETALSLQERICRENMRPEKTGIRNRRSFIEQRQKALKHQLIILPVTATI